MLFLPGKDGGVALRVAWDGAAVPDLTEYEHLSASVVTVGGQAWSELVINDPDVVRRAMPAIWPDRRSHPTRADQLCRGRHRNSRRFQGAACRRSWPVLRS